MSSSSGSGEEIREKKSSKEEVEENEETSKQSKELDSGLQTEWKSHLFPHADFEVISEGEFWTIQGSLKNETKRNMSVYKMKSGGLFCHSVVCLNEEAMTKLESFGNPEIILVPNLTHTADAGVWKKRYPSAKLVTPKRFVDGLLKKKNLKVEVIAEEIPKESGIIPHSPVSVKEKGGFGVAGELVYELELSNGKALVFTDLLYNWVDAKGLTKLLFGTTLCVPRPIRWFVLSDKVKFKDWLIKLAETENLQSITPGHGPNITKDCNQRLKVVAEALV